MQPRYFICALLPRIRTRACIISREYPGTLGRGATHGASITDLYTSWVRKVEQKLERVRSSTHAKEGNESSGFC